MRFSKDYSKFDKPIFTTIRKNSAYYRIFGSYKIRTPTKEFRAMIIAIDFIKKKDITKWLARVDFDGTRENLIKQLEKWYGKKFDDFMLLTMQKEQP